MTQLTLNIKEPEVLEKLMDFIDGLKGVTITKLNNRLSETDSSDNYSKNTPEQLEMLEKVCGAWSDNGRTSDEDIAIIYEGRRSGEAAYFDRK